MNQAQLTATPSLPLTEDGPIFSAPWQAQAFAITVRLFEEGQDIGFGQGGKTLFEQQVQALPTDAVELHIVDIGRVDRMVSQQFGNGAIGVALGVHERAVEIEADGGGGNRCIHNEVINSPEGRAAARSSERIQ